MNKYLIKISLLLAILSISEQTLALRCGRKLVDIGENKYKVAAICGEPDFKEIRTIRFPYHCTDREYYQNETQNYYRDYIYRNHSNFTSCKYKKVDVWTYNLGPRKFMRELIFIDGVVKEINTLDYGY